MSNQNFENQEFELSIVHNDLKHNDRFFPTEINIKDLGLYVLVESKSISTEFKGKMVHLKFENKDYIFILTQNNIIAAYFAGINVFEIGKIGLDEMINNQSLFEYYLKHEIAHKRYYSLNTADQVALNNLFFNDPYLFKLLSEFAHLLYTSTVPVNGQTSGEMYLNNHLFESRKHRDTRFAPIDEAYTLKDATSLKFKLDGTEYEVFAGFLITEFLSHYALNMVSDEIRVELFRGSKLKDLMNRTYQYVIENPNIEDAINSSNLYPSSVQEIIEKINEVK